MRLRPSRVQPVSWAEAALVIAGSWLVTGVVYAAVSAVFDEPGFPVAVVVVSVLAQWHWERRDWPAALAASLAGAITLFALLDKLRPEMGLFVGEALATGFAATAAVLVFTLVTRRRARR
ncbi:hypothetical protein GL263_13805 [Streptomyces durbertensis]|uniref:Integral membrane protein n=1 Tax=Streptomyces durbertensis TaxID=2448886 RepID=A0ABR6EH28_9ACTN|nr:hypothetical protein [Streptomyces durbertensis]